jgi:hypothetical protein
MQNAECRTKDFPWKLGMNKYCYTILVILSVVQIVHSQEYFPLQTGNRWFYRNSTSTYPFPYDPSKDDTSAVNVLSDTFMVQGKKYYTLSRSYLSHGRYVRADSHYIYIHKGDTAGTGTPYFDLQASVGDSLRVSKIGPYYYTILTAIDTVQMFGVRSRVLTFSENGFTTKVTRFADKFGPISFWWYGDPPAPWPDISTNIIGCRLVDSSYGFVLSIPQHHPAPSSYTLHQNFPNPFNSETSIRFVLSRGSEVAMVIRNVLGEEIWRSKSDYQQPGTHTVRWNGKDNSGSPVSSGMYYYTVTTNGGSLTRTMILLK